MLILYIFLGKRLIMNSNLEKRYGLITAICLIVGAVIGSGIFFVNEIIFSRVGGRLDLAVIAWLIGGAIMFVMMWVWGKLALGKDGMGGLMEYTDELLGETYSYYLGWFLGTILYPAFVAILAWVSARFTGTLLGWDMVFSGGAVWMLAGVYMVAMFVMNTLSPILAGKFQVSTTFIKVIPLIAIGIVGVIAGISNGTYTSNFDFVIPAENAVSNPLFYAILSTVFAYAGSEEVLMMTSEIKNRERNLPIAIIVGALIIIGIYVLYTVGVFGAIDAPTLATAGVGVNAAFLNMFGPVAGSVLIVFIIISCLGAMNSGMMAGQRIFYALAIRGKGPQQDAVGYVDPFTKMPLISAIISLAFSALIFFLVFANSQDMSGYPYMYHVRWFGSVNFAISSLAPVTLMAFYIPVFVRVMMVKKEWNSFNRFIMPALSVAGALLLIYMVFYTNAIGAFWYLGFFALMMIFGAILNVSGQKRKYTIKEEVLDAV
jgi:APA family basic amino acid/polyamine antiporter